MQNKYKKAHLILIQMEALKEGDFQGRTEDLLVLANEILRDAAELAQEILAEDKSA